MRARHSTYTTVVASVGVAPVFAFISKNKWATNTLSTVSSRDNVLTTHVVAHFNTRKLHVNVLSEYTISIRHYESLDYFTD